jgi:Zn-dependent protease
MAGFSIDRDREALRLRLAGGIPIYVHWSLLLVPILLFSIQFLRAPLRTLVLFSAFTLLLFGSILLHELAHMLAARRQGIATDFIEIDGLGGVCHLLADNDRSAPLWRIALAGPIANLALAAIFYSLYSIVPDGRPFPIDPELARFTRLPPAPPSLAQTILWMGFLLNVLLAAINLLPAFNLDGGTIAQEWLAKRWGYRRATWAVGIAGVALATVSTVLMVLLVFTGHVFYVPPGFEPNLNAIRQNRA